MTDFVTLLAAPLTAVTAFWKDCELGPYHFLGLLASWFMTWRCRRWEGVIPVTGSVAEGKAVLFALAVAKSRPREAVSVTEPEAGTLALLPKPRLLKVGGGGGGAARGPWPPRRGQHGSCSVATGPPRTCVKILEGFCPLGFPNILIIEDFPAFNIAEN